MLHPVFARLANAVLPHQCLLCRQFAETAGLCGTCWTGLKPISAPMCDICGRPLPHQLPQGRCGHCWLRPPPLERMRAWCLYSDTSRDLILKFKHGGGLFLTPFFAAMMTGLCRELLTPDTLIIPVPLHRWRYLKRRYNQSAELARALAARHDPQQFAPDILYRRKRTPSQAGLNRRQRQQNLANAFDINPKAHSRLVGRAVLLVDDVMTTGATLHEAARTLQRGGCQRVMAMVIARTQ